MFDLFRSREKSVRYVLGFLLGLVALSMVITLVPGYVGLVGGGGSDPMVVAEIGDQPLTVMEVRKVLARELKGNRIQQGMESIYVPMFVQQMISERALAYQAEKLGFTVTQKELSETIASLIPQLFEGGKFVGKDVYAAFLAQQNLSIPEFEDSVKKQALATKLLTLAVEGVVVTPAEVEAEFRRRNEKIKLSYFILSPETFTAKASPTDQEMRDQYEKSKAAFMTPEKRGYLIFGIDEPTVAATMSVSDEALRQAYKDQQERFRTPERVKARHILLMTTDKPKAEVDKLRAKAEDLLKKLQGGADFAALAQANSDDKGSAVNGGDLGYLVRGQTVPEFEKVAFSTPPGKLSGIVTTMYGFHIIQVQEKEQARVKPFEEVKAEIQQEVVRNQVYDKMQRLADEIRSALVRSPAEAEKIARANGISVARVPEAGAGDPLPEIGVSPDFTESTRGLPKGGVSPVIPIGDNKLVVAQVSDIIPPRPSRYEEVAVQLRSQLASQKAVQLMEAKVKELEAQLKGGASLADLAKNAGVEVKTPEPASLAGEIEGLGTSLQVQEMFRAAQGATMGPLRLSTGVFFGKVIEKIPVDLTRLAEVRQATMSYLKGERAQTRRDVFTDGIVNRLIKEKKVKVYEENIQKLVESYRS